MSANDEGTSEPRNRPLNDLNANDAVLGDEGVPPTVYSERPTSPSQGTIRPNRSTPLPVTEDTPKDPVYTVKHSTIKHVAAVVAALAIVMLGVGGMIGVLVGKSGAKVVAPERVTVTVKVPANANSREAIAKRNVVWRMLNHDADTLPESPEKRLGMAIDLLISKNANAETRLDGFTAFIKKGAAYFDENQSEAIEHALAEGTSAEVAEVMRKIVVADGEASDLLRGVLSDQKRIKSIVAGQKVPLETMPDGSRP